MTDPTPLRVTRLPVGRRASGFVLVAKGLPDEETECSRAEGCGSINEVGWRFQPFGINDLEMVDQNIASWTHLPAPYSDCSICSASLRAVDIAGLSVHM